MNRKEPDHRTKRPRNFGANAGAIVGVRHLLAGGGGGEAECGGAHMQLVTSKVVDMQIRADSMSVSSASGSFEAQGPSPSLGGLKTKPMYQQKAMDAIRMSLEPFANKSESASSTTTSGIGSASAGSSPCPSTQNGGMGLSDKDLATLKQHQLQAFGYDEDQMIRALNANAWAMENSQLDMQSKLHCDGLAMGLVHSLGHSHGHSLQNGLHKPSSGHLSVLHGGNRRRGIVDEEGFNKIMRKPSFDRDPTPSIGRFSASPAMDSSTVSTRSDSPSVRTQGDPPRLISQPPNDSTVGHVPVSRQYSPNFALEPPPPPPPPRPRGPPSAMQSPLAVPTRGTTPPPPLPPTSSSSAMVSQQQDFRCGQPTTAFMMKRISPVYQGSAATVSSSQSSTASPLRGTSPVSLARSPMMVPSFSQTPPHLQAILYNGTVEPPPPYPMPASSSKLRQSPTHAKRTTPTSGSPSAFRQQMVLQQAVAPQQAVAVSGVATSTSVAGQRSGSLAPMQAWNARHPPIIMQSVKSTQVPKPVLQTAIAPAAPSSAAVGVGSGGHQQAPPPPPSYSTAMQQKSQMESHQSSSSSSSSACTTPTFAALPPPPEIPARPQSPGVGTGVTVPTTDPPSYASAMQEFAAQRGMPSTTTTTTASLAGLPSYGLPLFGMDAVSQADTQHNHHGQNNAAHRHHYHHHHHHHHQQQQPPPPPHLHRKFSPKPASRAESPASSTSSSSPATVAGQGMLGAVVAPEDKGPPPSPPPQKITLHSPIPERKAHSKESDEERTIVRVYSPQAYKFYMEQHVENVINSYQQRMRRKMQLENEMAKVGLSEEAQCQMRRMLHQKESNYIRQKRAKMDKSMFSKLKTIGVGAFGEVALVHKKDAPRCLYAMKTLRKSDVLKRNQVAHVKAERDILAEADNEWVVKLYYSFQDRDNLYFVMDYVPGGDLMSLLIKFGIFEEHLARFYIAELICAIESVHKMGFIHRDIKPDNILIDQDGHIKLTDFGLCTGFRWTHNSKYYQRNGEHGRQDSMDPDENWSNDCMCNAAGSARTVLKPLERRRRREHQRCLAHSLVGTPNYIAPEVLMRTGYTQLCDWWSVGVILYEMLVGQPPFLSNNPAETQYKVINWETTLHIPKQANLAPESKDLILKLCTSHDRRLGKNGASEVKSHSFFGDVDFVGGLRRQPAPYIPTVKHATDTSNFDPVDPEKLRNSDEDGSERADQSYDNGKHPEHAFYEFTFRRFFDDGGNAYPFRDGGLDDNDNNQGPVYV